MKKEIVDVPEMKTPLREDGTPVVPISMGVKAGDFVYVSGLPPIDRATGEMIRGDIQAQTRQSLENVKYVLECAGSSLDKVVKVTVYCTNSGYFHQVNDIYRQYFSSEPPARTFVTVGSWPMPFDIEIECVAIA